MKVFIRLFYNSKKLIPFIFICYLLLGFYYGKWRTEKIIQWDVIVYYEYLTAAFMFNDMSFEFAKELPEDFDGEIWLETGPNDERFPKTTLGVAIMLTPTYLIAYLINSFSDSSSYGYSSFFQFFIFLAGLFHFVAGLVILRRILQRFFNEHIVSATLLTISFATGLLYYACLEAGMSHIYSFFLFSYLILLVIQWHERPSWKNSILLGIVLGLIVLVRANNALLIIIPALYGIHNRETLLEKINLITVEWKKVMVAAVFCCSIVFLQFWFWKYSTESWFVYSYGEESFFWNDPKISLGLFGFRKGLFIYTPILIFALMGMFLKSRSIRKLKPALLVFMVLNTYVILSWWCWWYGGGFGHRAFVDSLVIFAIFLAVFYDWVRLKNKAFISTGVIFATIFCIILNQYQIKQYSRGHLHWDGMTYKAYKELFFKSYTSPEYWEYIEQPDYEKAKKGIDR